MAATFATYVFVGLKTGQTYHVDAYVPDAVGSYHGFDTNGAGATASSPANWTAPEDVMLRDIIYGAVPTATRYAFAKNNQSTGDCGKIANVLYSVVSRPPLALRLLKGEQLQVIGVA